MKSWVRVCSMMMIAGLVVLLGGCGGGGNSTSGNMGRFEGVARISATAEHPMIGIVRNMGTGMFITPFSSRLGRPTTGWEDESFTCALPEEKYSPLKIKVFDDLNIDGEYNQAEELGSYPGSLKFDPSTSKWQLWHTGVPDTLIASDVTRLKGRDIYINCEP